jgi:hypothetical protein
MENGSRNMAEEVFDLSAVLDKIARLKALNERPGTEAEAQVAASMITKLMLRYNLSQSQVDGAGIEATLAGAKEFSYDLRRNRRYARNLMNVIANQNFGDTIFVQGTSWVHVFAREYNYQNIVGLYEYLLPIVERLARQGYKAYSATFEPSGWWDEKVSQSTWQTGFLTGFSVGLQERLQEQKEWLRQQQSGASAIVLLTNEVDQAMTSFWQQEGRKAVRPRASRGFHRDAYNAGRHAGRTTSLADRMEG